MLGKSDLIGDDEDLEAIDVGSVVEFPAVLCASRMSVYD
jgi:hypothetical protein